MPEHGPARAAIVTGGSSGIGLAIARVLLEEGHGVTLVARRAEKLAAAAEELRAGSAAVHRVAGDLGEEASVARVVAEHRERFGRLDVLVNNAGVGIAEPVGALTTRYLDLQLATNLRATMLCYREAVALLCAAAAERGRALVVNTASIAGIRGEPLASAYSAAKAGVIAFTQAMNRELGADGIRSTALCPGLVDTAMVDYARGRVPAEALIAPADVAEAVRWLLRVSRGCVVPELRLEQADEAAAHAALRASVS